MNHAIDVQIACEEPLPIREEQLYEWINLALGALTTCELTLRLVSLDEITSLNHIYRHKNKPTNVLAFPGTVPQHIELEYRFLGDIIICPAILEQEATQYERSIEAHWAHIVIHGVLHLLGYDHIEEHDEQIMQAVEINLLAECGFANPYLQEEYHIE